MIQNNRWIYSAVLLFSNCTLGQYKVPDAEVKAFYPRGFQISIPADEDVTSFWLHGKVNEKFEDVDNSSWHGATTNIENGSLIYQNNEVSLDIGDTLYYWTVALRQGLTYGRYDGEFLVENYVNDTGERIDPITTAPRPENPSQICNLSVTEYNGILQSCANRLIFEEQFTGRTLNAEKWILHRRFGGQPDFEFTAYFTNRTFIQITEDNLVINPGRLSDYYDESTLHNGLDLGETCTGQSGTIDCNRSNPNFVPPIISGQISTKGLNDFRYARIVIRAKVPSLDWAFPQFFLEPVNNTYGNLNYSSGQMRAAFTRGSDPCRLFGGVLFTATEQFRYFGMCEKMCKNNFYWSQDYHIYELKWTPDSIEAFVDGEKYCQIKPRSGFGQVAFGKQPLPNADLLNRGTKLAPFDQAFYLTIGVGIGGHGDFPDTTQGKTWANSDPRAISEFANYIQDREIDYPHGELFVDYVKVFSV